MSHSHSLNSPIFGYRTLVFASAVNREQRHGRLRQPTRTDLL